MSGSRTKLPELTSSPPTTRKSSEKPRTERAPPSDKRTPEKKTERTSSSSKHVRDTASKSSKTSSSSYSYKVAPQPAAKLLVDPANHLSPDQKLERVQLGEIHIISYPGTSQYSQGAPSACGLAALNAIRVAFDQTLQGSTGIDLVRSLSSLDTHLDATAICAHWSSRGHLEPDDLFKLPLFRQALKVYDRVDKLVGFQAFLDMLNALRMADAPDDITAALLTRPPEIVSIFRIPLSLPSTPAPNSSSSPTLSLTHPRPVAKPRSDSCIYAIFDSHSRPEHPTGAGLTLLPSVAAAANHLTALLKVQMNTRSPALQWEAQLMAQFSAHLVCRAQLRSPTEERNSRLAAVYEANAGVLRGKEAEDDAKRALGEVEELKTKVKKLERELRKAEEALASAKSKPTDPSQPPKPLDPPKPDPLAGLSEDALFALRMQEEFDAEDLLITTLAQETEQGNTFDCGICFETFHPGALAPMDGCDHPYCRECMRDYVQSKLTSRTFPILCPTCHAAKGGGTQGTVGQGLIETIGLNEEQYATYVELSLASLSVMVHCRKCQRAAFVVRADLDSEENVIHCPLPDCSYVWCKNCNRSLEGEQENHSCDGTSELKKLMAEEGWKDCPGCKTPISRNEGCYHMTCGTPGCNCHFCYRCGALIVKSVDREEIQSAVNEHLRGKCSMFDSPAVNLVHRILRR
ncbi:hypothetical protein BDV93DRAFT_527868 [Ceratobasidium sp. AG-I]|nr:hypothetical protein BDV93DRAFT_527868 [Ceratobasidium sp. AG-I]